MVTLSRKYQRLLESIFEQPVRKNLVWADIERLFVALGGEVIPKGGSVVRVYLEGCPATFHRPHPQKEAKIYMVKRVRKFLEKAGVAP